MRFVASGAIEPVGFGVSGEDAAPRAHLPPNHAAAVAPPAAALPDSPARWEAHRCEVVPIK